MHMIFNFFKPAFVPVAGPGQSTTLAKSPEQTTFDTTLGPVAEFFTTT